MSQSDQLRPDIADEQRSAVLVRIDVSKIQFMKRSELLKLQIALGFGSIWGVIEIPTHFMPAGTFQSKNRRVFDYRQLTDGLESAIVAITRLILLRWLTPIGNTAIPCSGSTLGESFSAIRRLAALAMTRTSQRPRRFWARLTVDDVYEIVPKTGKRNFVRVFETLQRRKLLSDVVQMPLCQAISETVRKGRPALQSEIRSVQPYLPFPDKFVGECGWRCLWLVNTLGPIVLNALEKLYESVEYRPSGNSHHAMKRFRRLAREFLSTWKWVDDDGLVIDALPFELNLNSQHGVGYQAKHHSFLWPPRSLPDCWALVALMQDAHVFLIGVSGGPREGEILGQTQRALVEAPSGWRVRGKTYKLVFRQSGEERDWPAPKITILTVLQQVRLARLTHLASRKYGHHNSGEHLWVQMPAKMNRIVGLPLNSLGYGLRRLVNIFGLQHLLSAASIRERNAHAHRMRKTTGRIVGLALSNAVQVLTDLYGHEDPDMTVGYLLSNPDIAEEAKAVAQAQTIMFASEAIAHADELGGRAGERLREDVSRFAKLRGMTTLDAQSIDELARDRTEGGLYWELVRPGVICTKLPGQVGDCNHKQGAPDPTHCRSTCDHRLEMAAEKANVDRTVERIIAHLEKAIVDDEPMAEQLWRGQLLANIFRFKDVQMKWSEHPLVAEEVSRVNSGKEPS